MVPALEEHFIFYLVARVVANPDHHWCLTLQRLIGVPNGRTLVIAKIPMRL